MLLVKSRLDDLLFQFLFGTDAIPGDAEGSQGIHHRIYDFGPRKFGTCRKKGILSQFVQEIHLLTVQKRDDPVGDLLRIFLLWLCHELHLPPSQNKTAFLVKSRRLENKKLFLFGSPAAPLQGLWLCALPLRVVSPRQTSWRVRHALWRIYRAEKRSIVKSYKKVYMKKVQLSRGAFQEAFRQSFE